MNRRLLSNQVLENKGGPYVYVPSNPSDGGCGCGSGCGCGNGN